jgi:small conductance mechanosensitive channel
MDQFLTDIKNFFTNAGLNVLIGILIIIVGLLVCKIIKVILKRILKKAKRDEAIISFVVSLTDVVLKIVILISALATMGINTASIITVLGTCGVAIGLALKDSLGNLASGIIIIVNKPFKKDDYVQVGGVEGTVSAINLFNTKLVTADNKEVILPNTTAVNNPVVNHDGYETRRVDLSFSAPKGMQLQPVKEIISSVVSSDIRVLEEPSYSIRMTAQTADSIVFTLRVWCSDKNYWDVLNDLNEAIYTELTLKGVQTPAAQLDVRVNKLP